MRDGSGLPRGPLVRVRDVADFQSRWPEFRPVVQEALSNPGLSADQADTLAWMVEVMDRISPRDLDEDMIDRQP